MEITSKTASELLEAMEQGTVTAVDVAQAFLDRISQLDGEIKAFIRCEPAEVLRQAASVDEKRNNGEKLGLLAGLPVAVKDNICVKGEPTTCGSKMLENYAPPYDATVIEKLRAADAVIIGKTNLDEFAMGGSTENSYYGATRNPWDTTRAPGGSSGGSAACVAAQMAPLSVGSDTGGSIRQPAGLCGVVGMKPTYGRISRYGLVAFASSLDQIGPFAQTAADSALLLEVLAGHDSLDATSAPQANEAYSQTVAKPLENLKLGIIREHFGEGLDEEVGKNVRDAVQVYESLGATVEEISLPHSKYGIAAYYIIGTSEASSNLARYDGAHYGHRTDEQKLKADLKTMKNHDGALVTMYRRSRSEGFGAEVKRRIMLGTYSLSAGYGDKYYAQALKVRRLIREDFDKAFEKVDLIVGPVSPTPAFLLGDKIEDPLAMYLLDLYTVGANLAGLPGISIPCEPSKSGLPIGLQLQGPALAEDRLLRAAHMYQQATTWHQQRPN